jgi:hypothetical protein
MDTTLKIGYFYFHNHVYFGQPMWYVHLWVGMYLYFMGFSWEINQEKCSTKNSAAKSVEHFVQHNFYKFTTTIFHPQRKNFLDRIFLGKTK